MSFSRFVAFGGLSCLFISYEFMDDIIFVLCFRMARIAVALVFLFVIFNTPRLTIGIYEVCLLIYGFLYFTLAAMHLEGLDGGGGQVKVPYFWFRFKNLKK